MGRYDGMVDITGGKMTLDQVKDEITRIMLNRRPSRLIIDLKLVKEVGWTATFWVTDRDFHKASDDNWLLRDNLPYP